MSALIGRIVEMRAEALFFNEEGDVCGLDTGVWLQCVELERSMGAELPDILALVRKDGQWSAWLRYPEWVLWWHQPETWEACCHLFAADVAERALNTAEANGFEVPASKRQALRTARLYATGRVSEHDLIAAREIARKLVHIGAWAPSWAVVYACYTHAPTAAERAATWADSFTGYLGFKACFKSEESVRRAAKKGACAAERRAQWSRLLQYVHYGIDAADMPWPSEEK